MQNKLAKILFSTRTGNRLNGLIYELFCPPVIPSRVSRPALQQAPRDGVFSAWSTP